MIYRIFHGDRVTVTAHPVTAHAVATNQMARRIDCYEVGADLAKPPAKRYDLEPLLDGSEERLARFLEVEHA